MREKSLSGKHCSDLGRSDRRKIHLPQMCEDGAESIWGGVIMNGVSCGNGQKDSQAARLFDNQPPASVQKVPPSFLEVHKPSELKGYVPPEGLVLVGDCHIMRGSCCVIGGAPGIGKSRALVALAEAGATCKDWFGLKVHRRFRTLIIQAENGRYRLKKEFSDLDCPSLDEWILVSEPPPYGFCCDRVEFKDRLAAIVAEFQPNVVCIDPWNALARDEKAKDYLAAFDTLRSIFPAGDNGPAIVIVAHTRKPRVDERTIGRSLLSELAGSYALASVPRSAFVMQAASDDPEDNRVVITCCKNNDGDMGKPTAWIRKNGLFAPVQDFDLEAFCAPKGDVRQKITEEDMDRLFESGRRELARAHAAKELEELTGAGRSACYNALKLDGRFGSQLSEQDGRLKWSTN